jgi:hypothetical protein
MIRDKEARRQGGKEARRQGGKEARRQGGSESMPAETIASESAMTSSFHKK